MSSSTDYKYFKDNLAKFYKEYGHSYIVIKERKVIGVFDEFDEALHEMPKTEEPGTFIIQECVDDPKKLLKCIHRGGVRAR
jgi:hypothetical protein